MMFPELIFGIIALILVRHTIWNIKVYMRKKNLKRLIRNIILSIMIVGFSWIWFVPIHVGQIGESPVCKFRFQVFEYEVHDYSGYGNIQDLLIRTVPVKYRAFDFYKKNRWLERIFWIKKSRISNL